MVDLAFVALCGGPVLGRLEHHRGGEVGDLFQAAVGVGGDRGVTLGGHDPFVGGEQVIGVGVEVGDAPDQGRPGDEVVTVHQEFGHQLHIPGVALDEGVVGVLVIGLHDGAVLGVVVDAEHRVTAGQQLLDDVAANEPGRARDHDLLLCACLLWVLGVHGVCFLVGLLFCSAIPAAARVTCSVLSAGPNAKRYQRR